MGLGFRVLMQESPALAHFTTGLINVKSDCLACGVCRLDVLREAAGQYQELNYITMKYKQWMLQQVIYLTLTHT